MADRIVHLSGVNKREVEAALGYELTPISASGDQFRIPEEVAQRISELPPSPPKAEDSFRSKEAARRMPFSAEDVESLDPVVPAASVSEAENEDSDASAEDVLPAEDAVGPDVVAEH